MVGRGGLTAGEVQQMLHLVAVAADENSDYTGCGGTPLRCQRLAHAMMAA